jgi:hypothetical protein
LVAGADIHELAVEASVARSVSTAGSPRLLIAHNKTETTSIDNMPIDNSCGLMERIGDSRPEIKVMSIQPNNACTAEAAPR